jgi:glycosyltransferase involved in cell wall biosynthesis
MHEVTPGGDRASNARQVIYVLWEEQPWDALIRRQVLELLAEMRRLAPELSIRIVSFCPAHRLLLNRANLRGVRAYLAKHRIALSVVPTLTPWPLPLPAVRYRRGAGLRPVHADHPALLLPLLLATAVPVLLLAHVRGASLFHARSYPAACAVMALQWILPRVRLVFDPRSDYPEEGVVAGRWRAGSLAFRMWKGIEGRLLRSAAVTACPAQTYVEHYRLQFGPVRTQVVPNNVDTAAFSRDPSAREESRRALGIADATKVFCYLGTLHSRSWHRPHTYAQLVRAYRQLPAAHVVLFLIPEASGAALLNALHEAGVEKHEYIVAHPAYADVPRMLAAADYGIMALPVRKVALGTKVVEYLSCGLPIVVNANCLGARELVARDGAGWIVNVGAGDLDATPDDCEGLSRLLQPPARERLSQLARDRFSNPAVARRYLEIYRTQMMEPLR